jgi:hypothetical protein
MSEDYNSNDAFQAGYESRFEEIHELQTDLDLTKVQLRTTIEHRNLLEDHLNEWTDRLVAEKRANKVLVEALEYYGDNSKYILHGKAFGVPLEGGEKARKALASAKELQNEPKARS